MPSDAALFAGAAAMAWAWRSARALSRAALVVGASASVPCALALPGKGRMDTRKVVTNALTGDGALFEEAIGVDAERARSLLSNMVRAGWGAGQASLLLAQIPRPHSAGPL